VVPEQEDRLAALRALRDGGGLERFLRADPLVAEGMTGHGPFARMGMLGFDLHRARDRRTLKDLAELIAAPIGIAFQLASLDTVALQLLQLVVWHGGPLDRATGLRLAGPNADPDVLDAAAQRLQDRLLTDPREAWVAPRVGVAEQVQMPGLLFREAARATPNDVLGQLAFIVGVDGGTKKPDRIEALEAGLRDPRTVKRLLERLDRDEQALFDALMAATGPVKVTTVGIDWFNPRWVSEVARPLHGLLARGLAGVASEDQHCWVWLDVQVAHRGHLFTTWPTEPEAPPAPLLGSSVGVPRALGRVDELLRLWEREPAPALKTGGLGVTPIRAAAKSIGIPAADAELLSTLMQQLLLLEPIVVGKTGRGRAATDELAWTTAPAVVQQWRDMSPAAQWTFLLSPWREGTFREPDPERWPDLILGGAVSLLLYTLRDLPEGRGLPEPQLVELLAWRHGGLFPPKVTAKLVAELRGLGLAPHEGPVGLTELGRAVLDDLARAEAMLEGGSRHVIVQADHTVIAPPDLHHDLAATLSSFTVLESDAGARIHRITEAALHRALERGLTNDDIVGFLRTTSSTPIPSNVERLIKDAAARFGQLRTAPATTVLVADDPALLASAAAVSAARLQIIAPTVAVSSLPEAKVLAALKAKGMAAVGTVSGPSEVVAARLRPWGRQAHDGLPAVVAPALMSELELVDLAGRLSDKDGSGGHHLIHRHPKKAKPKPKGRP
jgi:hypothetical protein